MGGNLFCMWRRVFGQCREEILPTLYRLAEVAKILGVEVAELFKTTPAEKRVSGYLEYEGRIVKVDSLDAVKQFVADVEAVSENSAE